MHGYEMEEEIERRSMRLWAKIGSSSIYRALKDLEKAGFVRSRAGRSARGPGKRIFSITDAGRAEFSRLVSEALASPAPVYSDRMTGLAFAMAWPAAVRRVRLRRSLADLKEQRAALETEATPDPAAEIATGFARDVLDAEIRALEKALAAAKG